ncbi:hypothetical protein Dsin_029613 [Dipteronia sinensis]|uniref:FRIGIDA-like protein n=1 Tax=Dipteronia sinensis TaxID=43782 RepID=A0AAD9ZT08_9ROSI|nr:hypothetical protein Dsin_029613 [Dipteronia sinensis]
MLKNSVDELLTLQMLYVFGRPSRAPHILEVIFHPPPSGCHKLNTYEAAFSSLGLAGCAWVFQTRRGLVEFFGIGVQLGIDVWVCFLRWTLLPPIFTERVNKLQYYIDPISHYKFRSKNEVVHFLKYGSKARRKKTNIDVDMEPLGSSTEQQSGEEEMIEEMISKGLQVNAVHHICELDLVDKFPPVPLLKAFLKNERKAAASIFQDPNNADRAAYLAAHKERSALRCVIQCIARWKLEAVFPPENLKKHLEKIETAFNI